MSLPLKNVVLVGGSGHLGPYILKALVTDGLNVTVATRNSSTATIQADVKVVRVSDDYPEDEMAAVFEGADAVVLCLGLRGIEKHSALVNASLKAGVKRLIASTYGGHDGNKAVQDIFPVAKNQHAVLDDVQSKERPGWSWTSLVPGLFFDMCIQTGFFGIDPKSHTATIWEDGNYQFSVTTRATIGRAVSSVLQHPEQTANRSVFISSFETSLNEILSAYKKATGVDDWSVTNVKIADMIEKGREEWSTGNIMGLAKLAIASHMSSEYGANFKEDGKLENELLGVGNEDFDEVMSQTLREVAA